MLFYCRRMITPVRHACSALYAMHAADPTTTGRHANGTTMLYSNQLGCQVCGSTATVHGVGVKGGVH